MHRQSGIAVTLLYGEQTNPRSMPFWGRQGYRLLWASREPRPAPRQPLTPATFWG